MFGNINWEIFEVQSHFVCLIWQTERKKTDMIQQLFQSLKNFEN